MMINSNKQHIGTLASIEYSFLFLLKNLLLEWHRFKKTDKMKFNTLIVGTAFALIGLLGACQQTTSTNNEKVEIVPTSTRAATEGVEAEEEQLMIDALAAINPTSENEAYFLNQLYADGKKSSNLGNGKYNNYLRVTFRLTSKPLYQKEIMEARQVCIREMMHTHYSHSKEAVIKELSEILAAEILLDAEKAQVSRFLDNVIAGMYQEHMIQFNCDDPVNCNFI